MTEEIKKKALKAFWDCVYTSVDADTGEALIFGETAFFDVLFNKVLASYSICSKEQKEFLDELKQKSSCSGGSILIKSNNPKDGLYSRIYKDDFKCDLEKVIE